MNESTPLVIRPLPHQREFVESDERAMVFEGGHGAGKTHALVLAALRDFLMPGYRAALVCSGNGYVNLFYKVTRILADCDVHRYGRASWRSPAGGMLYLYAEADIAVSSYNFIGVDGVEDLDLEDLKALKNNLFDDGRLRTTGESSKFDGQLGRVVGRHDAPNPHLDPDYVARVTFTKGDES